MWLLSCHGSGSLSPRSIKAGTERFVICGQRAGRYGSRSRTDGRLPARYRGKSRCRPGRRDGCRASIVATPVVAAIHLNPRDAIDPAQGTFGIASGCIRRRCRRALGPRTLRAIEPWSEKYAPASRCGSRRGRITRNRGVSSGGLGDQAQRARLQFVVHLVDGGLDHASTRTCRGQHAASFRSWLPGRTATVTFDEPNIIRSVRALSGPWSVRSRAAR